MPILKDVPFEFKGNTIIDIELMDTKETVRKSKVMMHGCSKAFISVRNISRTYDCFAEFEYNNK